MKGVATNLVDTATLSSNSVDANYPLSNVQDIRLSRVYHSTGDTSEWIVMDLGAATAVTYVALANHNLTSGATITIQGHTADSWGAPDYTNVVTWKTGVISEIFTSTTKRYWRLLVADASNPDTYIKIGRLCLAAITTLPGISINFTPADISTSVQTVSPTGQVYVDTGYNKRRYRVVYPDISLTDRTSLQTFFQTIDRSPTFFEFDETKITELAVYASIQLSTIEYNAVGDVFYQSTITIEEAK